MSLTLGFDVCDDDEYEKKHWNWENFCEWVRHYNVYLCIIIEYVWWNVMKHIKQSWPTRWSENTEKVLVFFLFYVFSSVFISH